MARATRGERGEEAMLYFMVTVCSLLAMALLITHWEDCTLCSDGAVLGTVLLGSTLWLLYCFWQVLLFFYRLVNHISQVIFDYRHPLTFIATLAVTAAFSVVLQVMSRENDSFYGNDEIYFGSRTAVLLTDLSEEQPVGRVRCRNLQEFRCVSEDQRPIPAGTKVELVCWYGNKLVVRPLTEADTAA